MVMRDLVAVRLRRLNQPQTGAGAFDRAVCTISRATPASVGTSVSRQFVTPPSMVTA